MKQDYRATYSIVLHFRSWNIVEELWQKVEFHVPKPVNSDAYNLVGKTHDRRLVDTWNDYSLSCKVCRNMTRAVTGIAAVNIHYLYIKVCFLLSHIRSSIFNATNFMIGIRYRIIFVCILSRSAIGQLVKHTGEKLQVPTP